MRTLIIAAALSITPVVATPASTQPLEADGPAFEVATVRENTSGEPRSRIELVNARFSAINMTLRELVSIVYPTDGGRFRHATQLVGGPGWFGSARFDIIARAEGFRGDTNRPGFTATAAERENVERVRLMMRRLLAERFQLRVHAETRQLPIYALVVLKSSGLLGPDIKRAKTDCMEEWKKQRMPDARNLACGSIQGARVGRMTGYAAEIGPLVRDLYDWTGRPVVDRTGLTGRFDFTLNWAPEGSTDTDVPSIFTAVQEQLGLKLEPARGPVDVLVVDSVERPAPEQGSAGSRRKRRSVSFLKVPYGFASLSRDTDQLTLTSSLIPRNSVMIAVRFSFFVLPFAISVLSAQVVKSDGPKPQFEVATVRPNKSGESGASLGPRPGGRLNGTNQTARNLIRNAFNAQPYQLIGGPDWMDSDRFDIVANTADADLDAKGMLTLPQFMLRLQSLLEDRFRMVTHWETRELPVYALVLVADGRLGPKLKVHAGECDRARSGAPPAPGSAAVNCGTRTNVTPTGGKMTGSGIRMETFARNLASATGRYVVDKTGLSGSYDLDFEFTPDQSPDTTGPSLFTAMQEQLGLKLDSQRAPVVVLVIERLERPAPD